MRLVAIAAFALVAPSAHAQKTDTVGTGRMAFSAGARVHVDARGFAEGPVGDSPGFLVRRARVELTAEVASRLRVVIEPGFGEGEVELLDGYAEAPLFSPLAVRVGRFKTPGGYESLASSSGLWFAERAFPTQVSPRRDLGALIAIESGAFAVSAGLFNGVADGASGSDGWGGGPDLAARAFGFPVDTDHVRLGVGLAVAAGTARGDRGDRLAAYESPGGRVVLSYDEAVVPDGQRLRLLPQATLDVGRLRVLGEAAASRHRVGVQGVEERSIVHSAWQVAASYVVAGELRGTGRPVPRRTALDGGPGAVEISARLHGLGVGASAEPLAAPKSVRSATAWAVAAHWTPFEEVRLGVTVERTVFTPFDDDATTPSEAVVIARAAVEL